MMMIGQERISFYHAAVLLTAAITAPVCAQLQFTIEYGVEFATIGDAGNRNTTPEEGNPIFADVHVPHGAVDYEYRMARTEVTLGQYVEFVEAYYPLY